VSAVSFDGRGKVFLAETQVIFEEMIGENGKWREHPAHMIGSRRENAVEPLVAGFPKRTERCRRFHLADEKKYFWQKRKQF
jgi:hypothetical protein